MNLPFVKCNCKNMLYTLFVLFLGIYLGQEYTVLPSVKTFVESAMNCFHRFKDFEKVQGKSKPSFVETMEEMLKAKNE